MLVLLFLVDHILYFEVMQYYPYYLFFYLYRSSEKPQPSQ